MAEGHDTMTRGLLVGTLLLFLRPALAQDSVALPTRLEFRTAFDLRNFSPQQVADIERAPGVSTVIDEPTGRVLHVIEKGTVESDGTGSLKVSTRSLIRGGREAHATRLELWGGGGAGETHATITGDAAKFHVFRLYSGEELISHHLAARRLNIEDRAQLAYREMLRYRSAVLSICNVPETPPISRADCLGASFTSADDGSLQSATIQWPDGDRVDVSYHGFRRAPDGSMHPTLIRHAKVIQWSDGTPPESSVRLTLIDSVAQIGPPPASLFDWRQYATSAHDEVTGKIVRADGRVDEAGTAQIRGAAPPPTGNSPPRGPDDEAGASSSTRWILVVSVTALIGGGIVWYRRRLP